MSEMQGYEVPEESEQLDQIQQEDSLNDRGVDDVLDEGLNTPENWSAAERGEHETLDQRLAEEEPDVDPYAEEDDDSDHEDENALDEELGLDEADERTGRLVQPDEGLGEDTDKQELAMDVGIDGAGASAEEAAMHITRGPDPDAREDY